MQRIGGPTPDQWVRQAGSLLGHLHLQDNDGTHDYHWAPGQGGVNWWALFSALPKTASTPLLVLEAKDTVLPTAHWLVRPGLCSLKHLGMSQVGWADRRDWEWESRHLVEFMQFFIPGRAQIWYALTSA